MSGRTQKMQRHAEHPSESERPLPDVAEGHETECVMCGVAVWTYGTSDVTCRTCESGW